MDIDFKNALKEVEKLYEKQSLKSAFWQDKYKTYDDQSQSKKLREQLRKTRRKALVNMTDIQYERQRSFRQKHFELHGKTRHLNTYIYTLTGTGIGTIIKIKCPICNEQEDITDELGW